LIAIISNRKIVLDVCRPPSGLNVDSGEGCAITAILQQLCSAQPMAVRQIAAAAQCSFTPLDGIPSALNALVSKVLLSGLTPANEVSLFFSTILMVYKASFGAFIASPVLPLINASATTDYLSQALAIVYIWHSTLKLLVCPLIGVGRDGTI